MNPIEEPHPELMTKEDAGSAVLAFAFSGALGSADDKGVTYSHLATNATTTKWIAGLEDFERIDQPVDRYLITIDRASRDVISHTPIVISHSDLEECVLAATEHHLKAFARSADGALSISYRVSVEEDDITEYLVQLRFFADVTSMDLLMTFAMRNASPVVLPIPRVYMIPGEADRQAETGFGKQITQFIHGNMAGSIYDAMTHETRLAFVRNVARAYEAIWDLPLPQGQRMIGELRATSTDTANNADRKSIALHVGPDRAHNFAEPFSSVRAYLRAFIHFNLNLLEKQEGIDAYKARYLSRIKSFIEPGMQNIPAIVETIPVVAQHCDLAPHNIIVSANNPAEIAAIIDWEFVGSLPFVSAHRSIEMLFREFAQNEYGPQYPHADELRATFWNAIPNWKVWYEHEATKVFLEWYRFALFLKPAEPDEEVGEAELWEGFWVENVSVVEGMLAKYGGL